MFCSFMGYILRSELEGRVPFLYINGILPNSPLLTEPAAQEGEGRQGSAECALGQLSPG